MSDPRKNVEKEERAARLVLARKRAGFTSAFAAADKFRWNRNTYKAHEQGRNGFDRTTAEDYAGAFRVPVTWLYLNIGSPNALEADASPMAVPLISMVRAGALADPDAVVERDDASMITAVGLRENGDWIALRVEGDSMDRISPPESIVFVDRKDKRLVVNACYIIADADGQATYKRYRSNPDRYEPVSTNDAHETLFPDNPPLVIGRVRRTMLDL